MCAAMRRVVMSAVMREAMRVVMRAAAMCVAMRATTASMQMPHTGRRRPRRVALQS
jgi:hypothetical protein